MASDTRDTLVAVAAQLLDEGGPEAVTLRRGQARPGVSRDAPYKHFADKEALLAAVAAGELARRTASLYATGPRPRLRGCRRRRPWPRCAAMSRGRSSSRSASGSSSGPRRRTLDEFAAAAGAARALLVEMVAEAQRAGRLPATDPERLASLLLAVTHGAVDLALAGHVARTARGRRPRGPRRGSVRLPGGRRARVVGDLTAGLRPGGR